MHPRNVKHFVCSSSQTDLHSKDESLIDTKGLLRSDQQRGDAGKRAREEQALIINLSDNSAVRAIKHPVRECTNTIPSRHKYNSISLSDFCTYFCFLRNVQSESTRNLHMRTDKIHSSYLFVSSLRAEFGAISNSSVSTSGLSI